MIATRVVSPTFSFIEPETSKTARSWKSVVADCHTSVARATWAASGCGPTLISPMLPCGVGSVTGTDVERRPNWEQSLAALGVCR